MTTEEQLQNKREQLKGELDELERKAGLTREQLERAWSGAFIPFGALGDDVPDFNADQNRQLYYDDEHDSMRRKVRALYFSVADVSLRKLLIAKLRELDDNAKRRAQAWIQESERALVLAKQKAANHGRLLPSLALAYPS